MFRKLETGFFYVHPQYCILNHLGLSRSRGWTVLSAAFGRLLHWIPVFYIQSVIHKTLTQTIQVIIYQDKHGALSVLPPSSLCPGVAALTAGCLSHIRSIINCQVNVWRNLFLLTAVGTQKLVDLKQRQRQCSTCCELVFPNYLIYK